MKMKNVYMGAALLGLVATGCHYSGDSLGGEGGRASVAPRATEPDNGTTPQAGQLTAGVWDENLNFNTKHRSSNKCATYLLSPRDDRI